VNDEFLSKVKDSWIYSGFKGSDHTPIEITINLSDKSDEDKEDEKSGNVDD